jgi:hypothetical protein
MSLWPLKGLNASSLPFFSADVARVQPPHERRSTNERGIEQGLSRSVFTRKAQVLGPDGKTIAEIKGTIREIEVYPNGTAEWWFVPIKTGVLNDLKCTIKGHAEAGMVGTITIK